jgi:sulfur-carrier protein
MKVEVKLFALLEQYLPADAHGDGIVLDLPAGTTVGHVVESLKIPSDLSCITVVNGHDVPPEHILVAGDVLAMFPPLAGGA